MIFLWIVKKIKLKYFLAIWSDIDYMHDYQTFSVNKSAFTDENYNTIQNELNKIFFYFINFQI